MSCYHWMRKFSQIPSILEGLLNPCNPTGRLTSNLSQHWPLKNITDYLCLQFAVRLQSEQKLMSTIRAIFQFGPEERKVLQFSRSHFTNAQRAPYFDIGSPHLSN